MHKLTAGIIAGMAVFGIAGTEAADQADEHRSLVQDFCFVLQAQGYCDGLLVHGQTEQRIADWISVPVRGDGAPYDDTCAEGFESASKADDPDFCRQVWTDFGCFGAKRAGLIMQSAFGNKGAITCKFE